MQNFQVTKHQQRWDVVIWNFRGGRHADQGTLTHKDSARRSQGRFLNGRAECRRRVPLSEYPDLVNRAVNITCSSDYHLLAMVQRMPQQLLTTPGHGYTQYAPAPPCARCAAGHSHRRLRQPATVPRFHRQIP